jgi:hypothetical protein
LDPETALLELLAAAGGDNRLGRGQAYLWQRFGHTSPAVAGLSRREHYALLWSLIQRGLVFLDINDASPDNWTVVLTERCRAAATRGLRPGRPDPLRPPAAPGRAGRRAGRARQRRGGPPRLSGRAPLRRRGHARGTSEVALLGLFADFAGYLDAAGPNTFSEQLGRKRTFAERFTIFHRFWASARLPESVKANSDVWINAAAAAIRRHRDDAVHAVAAAVDRSTAHMLLAILPDYLGKFYEVRRWLSEHTPATGDDPEGA